MAEITFNSDTFMKLSKKKERATVAFSWLRRDLDFDSVELSVRDSSVLQRC